MLSPQQIESMRSAVRALMVSRCTVWRKTDTDDGMGGQQETWAEAFSLPCLMRQRSREELQKAGVVVTDDQWKFLLPHDTSLSTADRLECQAMMFAVESVVRDDYLLCVTAYCRRLP